MSFNALESSVDSARPIRLYRFSLNGNVWRYTSSDTAIMTLDGYVWKPVAIVDDGIKLTGEAAVDALTITAQSDIGPAVANTGTGPSVVMQIVIFEKHHDDNELLAVYSGDISDVNFSSNTSVKFTCEALADSMQRDGLTLGWTRSCNHALYDAETCKVNATAWQVAIKVLSIDGFTVTVAGMDGQPNSKFDGGFISFIHPTKGVEYRTIESQVGGALLMFGTVDDIYPGVTGFAYPGCRRTVAACNAFGNYLNYGGFPHMPGKSPFSGDPIF